MKRYSFFLIIIGSIIVWSCARSGTKALERGQYYEAVLQAAEKLNKDNDNEKASSVLPEAYKLATKELLDDARSLENSNKPFRWEMVLGQYEKLNKMYDVVQKCRSCRKLVEPQDFFKKTEEIRDFAAFERYSSADNLLKRNDKMAARDAFGQFEKLVGFAPNYKDARDKMEEALSAGSYHIVLEQPRLNSRMFQYENEYFQNKIEEFLNTNRRLNKFVRFYSPSTAKSIRLSPDQVVRLEFIDFVVGETAITTDNSNVMSKDSVKVGDVTIEGKKVEVRNRVSAQLSKSRKSVRSRGLLSMEIYDFQTNRRLFSEEVPGEFLWVHEWASFNGDERALTDEQRRMTKNREALPPAPQQLFIEFTKPIYDQVTSRIKRFYDRY
jgi:hypothetical protein